MNIFASLAEPLRDRPGDPMPYMPEPAKPQIRKRPTAPANRWGLTYAECRTLTVLCEVGTDKLAAKQVGVTVNCVEAHIASAKKKMGLNERVLAILTWDRFTREQA